MVLVIGSKTSVPLLKLSCPNDFAAIQRPQKVEINRNTNKHSSCYIQHSRLVQKATVSEISFLLLLILKRTQKKLLKIKCNWLLTRHKFSKTYTLQRLMCAIEIQKECLCFDKRIYFFEKHYWVKIHIQNFQPRWSKFLGFGYNCLWNIQAQGQMQHSGWCLWESPE